VPGYGAGVLEKIGNFAQYVDSRLLRGHMWGVEAVWDPEGIVSTLPAIATTLFGVLAGELLAGSLSRSWKCLWLLAGGSLAVAAGLGLQPWMPINKSLWTVPFALLTVGLAAWCFAICYWVAEVRGWRWWTQPFVVFGMNPIALYVLAGLAARSLNILSVPGPGGSKMPLKEFIFRHTFAPLAEPANASLIFSLFFVLVFYGIGLVMYRKRWFIKV